MSRVSRLRRGLLFTNGLPPYLRSLYYLLKPAIPRAVQLALRRKRCRYLLAQSRHLWPIDPEAGRRPEGWPGWPDGKRFAVVLTHDVESGAGIARVPELMRLEESLGFRSSFNLVIDDYPVPDELRSRLQAAGFEVGVHGLHHNGLMYASRRIFRRHARRINEALDRWGAVGFRSPAMHHELEWMHELRIRYDSSTFDTDPFEPQPDGIRTIFPVWMRRQAGSHAYVELPYTLAQDFTLFVLLEETGIDLWKRKVDWIAERGGMVLVNTHPDYMRFGAGDAAPETYPVRLYGELLEYVRGRYAGQYWHALPRTVAEYFAKTLPAGTSAS